MTRNNGDCVLLRYRLFCFCQVVELCPDDEKMIDLREELERQRAKRGKKRKTDGEEKAKKKRGTIASSGLGEAVMKEVAVKVKEGQEKGEGYSRLFHTKGEEKGGNDGIFIRQASGVYALRRGET